MKYSGLLHPDPLHPQQSVADLYLLETTKHSYISVSVGSLESWCAQGMFDPSEHLCCLSNLYAEYIMRNGGLGEAQARVKIAGRNINNLRYADDTTLMTES